MDFALLQYIFIYPTLKLEKPGLSFCCLNKKTDKIIFYMASCTTVCAVKVMFFTLK